MRPLLRNRRDAVSNLYYVVRAQKVLMATTTTTTTTTSNSGFYYDPARPSGFSTLPKLLSAVLERKGIPQSVGSIRAWLEEQDTYTLRKPVRRRFSRNPYTVTNVMNVWD